MKKKFGLLMLISTGILLGLTGCGKEQLNVNEYVTLKYEGYDGYGEVKVDGINSDDFYKSVVKLAGKNAKIDVSDETAVKEASVILLEEALENASIEESSNLSNGDKIKISSEISESTAEKFESNTGIKIKCNSINTKVKGLKDPADFDIKDYVSFKTEGYSPNIEIKAEKNTLKNWPKFKYSQKEGLKNGDVVTIQIGKSESEFEAFRTENNLPEFDRTFTYTVEGAPSIVESYDEVTDELLDDLKSKADSKKDKFLSYYEGVNSSDYSLTNIGYNYDKYNKLRIYMIYKNNNSNPSEVEFKSHNVIPNYCVVCLKGNAYYKGDYYITNPLEKGSKMECVAGFFEDINEIKEVFTTWKYLRSSDYDFSLYTEMTILDL
ncbi:hypothetical protein SAMN02910413_0809 [Pseudobutyrivibrio sp. C4]|uniref:hypothetical protein n=1 Tax=Pseudobutyrivibrio sp. C4 TaxID=1520803 RepID=UPI0008BCDD3A|nr:hypothetical protein [Pseudobutyrivibrio sp. C4]SES76586.1 hypothetical protein SAMN02910413_0809 [Pseudobutyrivibrio sp. C4]